MRAAPGQFFSLRFGVPGLWWQSHPYSLSSAPFGEGLRFTFHASGHDASAFGRIRPGTRVWAQGPYGTLTADRAGSASVALIAGGSGVAPLRALLEDLRPEHSPVLLLRVSRGQDAWFVEELQDLLTQRGGALHVIAGRRGQLGYDPFAASSLQALIPNLDGREVFVCGPAAMSQAVNKGLRASGVPRRSIHIERYTF